MGGSDAMSIGCGGMSDMGAPIGMVNVSKPYGSATGGSVDVVADDDEDEAVDAIAGADAGV